MAVWHAICSYRYLKRGTRTILKKRGLMFPLRNVTLLLCVLVPACTRSASASSISLTGNLASPESYVSLTLNVGGVTAQTIDLQTWGFGGGTNAAGQLIAPGGFDSLLALFSGTGPGASFINGTSDISSNFGSFMGCPPAGTVGFSNGDAVCGDLTMSFMLAPGSYTLVLADAGFIPNAFSDNGTLGEGFTDLTGGVFQTCDTNLSGVTSCITPSNAWALDITGGNFAISTVPEPAPFWLLGGGLLGFAWLARHRLAVTT